MKIILGQTVDISVQNEHAVWRRNHEAVKAGKPIEPGFKFVGHHNIPAGIPLVPPGGVAALNQYGAKCDSGYTGDLCNIREFSWRKNSSSYL